MKIKMTMQNKKNIVKLGTIVIIQVNGKVLHVANII